MSPELPAGAAAWLLVGLVPIAAVCCTAFAKASVVLSAVRVGLGAEALLPYSAVFALALVAAAVVMGPIAQEIALAYGTGPVDAFGLLEPLAEFLRRHADAGELSYFAGLNGVDPGHPLALVPAFLITELGEALEMAALIIVPFVLVDLVVAQVIALIGLPGQVQQTAALPVKLLLFVAVGGWDAVVRGLIAGYA